jgi:hypothetical protein
LGLELTAAPQLLNRLLRIADFFRQAWLSLTVRVLSLAADPLEDHGKPQGFPHLDAAKPENRFDAPDGFM